MATLRERMLDGTSELLNSRTRSQAYRRRAVSAAYYAVFHAVAKLCADELLGAEHSKSDDDARVYRALDHGALKAVFSSPPLNTLDRLRPIGDTIVRLQSERHKADYSPPGVLYTPEDGQELVDLARVTVMELGKLPAEDRRTLATCLLFRVRRP